MTTNFTPTAKTKSTRRIADASQPYECIVRFTSKIGPEFEEHRLCADSTDNLYKKIFAYIRALENATGHAWTFSTLYGNVTR